MEDQPLKLKNIQAMATIVTGIGRVLWTIVSYVFVVYLLFTPFFYVSVVYVAWTWYQAGIRDFATLAGYLTIIANVFGIIVNPIVCFGLLFTPLYFLSLLYMAWMWYDRDTCHRGGRRSTLLRTLIVWKLNREYFPIQLIKTAPIDPNRNYIFGCHPHGALPISTVVNFGSEGTDFSQVFPGITPHLVTLSRLFWVPLIRESYMGLGLCAASEKSFNYILTKKGKGNSVMVVVGGVREMIEARPNQMSLIIKNRKGFVKQAIVNGADLVPVISFGENDVINGAPNPEGSPVRRFQKAMINTFGFCPPIVYGKGLFKYTFSLSPEKKPIHTVVGSPMEVVQDANPSDEMIDHYHSQYMQRLQQLFEEYKIKLGYKHLTLILS